MRCKLSGSAAFADQKWQDRVDDHVDAAHVEDLVFRAIEFAQTVVERAIEPLIDVLDLAREFRHQPQKGDGGTTAAPNSAGTTEGTR